MFSNGSDGGTGGLRDREEECEVGRHRSGWVYACRWMETVPDAGELQANVSLANADKYVADSETVGGTEVSDEWWSNQKRSQQAFGGVRGRCDRGGGYSSRRSQAKGASADRKIGCTSKRAEGCRISTQ